LGVLFAKAWSQIKDFFKGMDRSARIRFGILAGVVVAIAIVSAALLGRVNYKVLYYNLAPAEAGTIISALSERGVPYRTEGTGTILVPEEQVSELLMTLSSEGVYDSGELDFSILQSASGFGVTDIERQAYLALQYQDNIRRALLRLDKIDNAIVLISMPEESSFVFSRDARDATASVQLEIKNGASLSPSEAVAIGELVAAAAPGLLPENVRIVDSAMNLYSAVPIELGTETDDASAVAAQIMLETQVKQQLETSVINLLAPVFGAGRVKAAVSVTLGFDRESSTTTEFAPPVPGETEGLVRSMERMYERTRDGEAAGGVPGTDSNGMGSTEDIDGTDEYPYLELGEGENYAKLLETINYELNETTTQLEKARGVIERLSVGVLVDSSVVEEDYTTEVRDLVAKAVGVGEDSVSVQRLPIKELGDKLSEELSRQAELARGLKMRELLQTLAICLTALLALGLLLSAARGMAKKVKGAAERLPADGPKPPPGYENIDFDGYDGMDGVSYVPGSAPSPGAYTGVTASELEDVAPGDDAAPARDERLSAAAHLERMIDKDPKAVARVLRNWLTED
jgi:flagellar M-ring protein FliF